MKYSDSNGPEDVTSAQLGVYAENVAVWLYDGQRYPPPNAWDDGSYQDDPGVHWGDLQISDYAVDMYEWMRATEGRFRTLSTDVPIHPRAYMGDSAATSVLRLEYRRYLAEWVAA